MTREEALQNIKKVIGFSDTLDESIFTLFPELKESEDGRIRKELIELISCMHDADPRKKGWIAWLEKQKEPTKEELYAEAGTTEKEYIANTMKIVRAMREKQKEHQNNSDAQEKSLGRDLTFPQDKDMDLDEIAQDYIDGVKEYNPEPTWDLMQTAVCYGYHYREQKEQKPAEWSEEDKETIDLTIAVLKENLPNDYFKTNPANTLNMGAISTDELINRLKSLSPQPKVKWSEEDEKMLNLAIEWAETMTGQFRFVDMDSTDFCKITTWLKSLPERFNLQPQAKQEQKPEAKLTGWVARDSKYNSYFGLGLVLFKGKPRRSGECWSGAIAAQLPWELFPDLKWMGEPMEVEITITKK